MAVLSDTLDAEREMAKRFGAKAVRKARPPPSSAGSSAAGGRRQRRRVLLVQPYRMGRPHGLIKMQTLPNERPASSDDTIRLERRSSIGGSLGLRC